MTKLCLEDLKSIATVNGRQIASPTSSWYKEQSQRMTEEIEKIDLELSEAQQKALNYIVT